MAADQPEKSVTPAQSDTAKPPSEPPQSEIPPVTTTPKNPARKISVLLLIFTVTLVAWYVATDRLAPYSARGAVAGYVTQLTPRVAGQVTEVFVKDGDIVEPGTPLFQLDPRQFELAVQQAKASLTQTLQSTAASAASIVSSQAAVSQARANLENIRSSTNRTLALAERGLVSKSQADNTKAELKTAQAQLDRANADLESAMLALGQQGASNPEVQAAQVRLEQTLLDLQFSTITAPTKGAITNLQLAIGQYVSPGAPALTFFDARGAWVTTDLRENQLGNVQPGDRADIIFDAVPGRVFSGRVQSIAWGIDPGRPSAGGLIQNKPESQWFEPARRIPVHVELDGNLDNWPKAARAGGKVGVVVYAEGTENPIAWISAGLLRLRAWLSYLY